MSINFSKNGLSDLHIHPRPDCTNIEVLNQYVKTCTQYNIKTIGFVEHGKRCNGHQSILDNEKNITNYINACKLLKKRWSYNININCGIEIDYFNKVDKTYNNLIYESGFDYIIGSIHGIKLTDYDNYLDSTIDMLNKYQINILGHMQFIDNYICYLKKIEKIFHILRIKHIKFEFNIATRYGLKNKQQFILSLLKEHEIEYTWGSDSHSIQDIVNLYQQS